MSVPRGDTAVLKHFQAQMPYGLIVPEDSAGYRRLKHETPPRLARATGFVESPHRHNTKQRTHGVRARHANAFGQAAFHEKAPLGGGARSRGTRTTRRHLPASVAQLRPRLR
jgi:hypothetical protein